MPEPPAGQPATITVLSLSPAEHDLTALQQTLHESSLYPNCRVTVQPISTLGCALAALGTQRIPIVICDEDAYPGAWRELVAAGRKLPAAPCVIATSRQAEDRAWAEILSGGAFDLLTKPFSRSDVTRVVQSAWVHWRNRHGLV